MTYVLELVEREKLRLVLTLECFLVEALYVTYAKNIHTERESGE